MITSLRTSLIVIARSTARLHIRKGDANYAVLTEGRTDWRDAITGQPRVLNWCAEFVSYVCARTRKFPYRFINRIACRGTWLPGQTISMLRAAAQRLGAYITDPDVIADRLKRPECVGDILILGPNSRHICFLDEPVSGSGQGATIRTADGNGQNHESGLTVRPLVAITIEGMINVDVFATCGG